MLVLFYFVGFINNVLASLSTENPVIHFNKLNLTEYKTYVVVRNKPLYIILENFDVKDVWCADYNYKERDGKHVRFVAETFDRSKIFDSRDIFIPAVTNEMNAQWKCSLTTCIRDCSLTQLQQDLMFYVHVKGAISPNITVNGINFERTTADLSNVYDGTLQYEYEESEIIEVSCDQPDIYGVQMKYFDVNGNILFQTDRVFYSYVKFSTILKSENNNSYIECSLDKSSPGHSEYVYRITLVQKNSDLDTKRDGIAVSVNGIKLVPSIRKSESYNKYKYTSVRRDSIYLTCEKRTALPASVAFSYSEDFTSSDIVEQSGKITVPLTIRNQKKTVFCITEHNETTIFSAEILLTFEVEVYVPVLRGLPEKNIVYRYTKNTTQHVIVYQYTNNEILNLTCTALTKTYELQWFFDNQIDTPSQQQAFYSKLIKRSFALEDRHNGSTIKCIKKDSLRNYGTVEVILHQKADVAPDINTERTPDDIGDDKRMIHLVYILGSLLFVAILIIISGCAIFWYKKNKIARHLRTSYESLTRQTDSPIPSFPSQWGNHYEDHYTHIDANVNTNNSEDSQNSGNLVSVTNTPYDHLYTEIDDYVKPNDGMNPTWSEAQSKIKNMDKISTKKLVDNIQPDSSSKDLHERWQDLTYDKLRLSGIDNSNNRQNCSNASYKNRHFKSNPKYSNNTHHICNSRPNNSGITSNSENDNVIFNHDKTKVKQRHGNQVNPNLGNYVNSFVRDEQTDPDMYDYAEPYGELHITNECEAVTCDNDLYNVK